MKKLIFYMILMIIIVIVMPLTITKGCKTSGSGMKQKSYEKQQGKSIKVYFHKEDKVKEIDLDEYLVGVVAAEMPAEFQPEALKAQAVAARTYACTRVEKLYTKDDEYHKGADICTDHNHCQDWISKEDANKNWGSNADKYWAKIEDAVSVTKRTVVMYDGKMINALYHSSSCGKTENVENVWESEVAPYLKSVDSPGEEESKNYKFSTIIAKKEVESILKDKYPEIQLDKNDMAGNFKISEYTEGGRVKTLTAGNIVLSGNRFREMFSLKSANFTIENADKNNIKITTLGSGHGVGMSQWGANYLAKTGKTYEEILKYYYTGCWVSKY